MCACEQDIRWQRMPDCRALSFADPSSFVGGDGEGRTNSNTAPAHTTNINDRREYDTTHHTTHTTTRKPQHTTHVPQPTHNTPHTTQYKIHHSPHDKHDRRSTTNMSKNAYQNLKPTTTSRWNHAQIRIQTPTHTCIHVHTHKYTHAQVGIAIDTDIAYTRRVNTTSSNATALFLMK